MLCRIKRAQHESRKRLVRKLLRKTLYGIRLLANVRVYRTFDKSELVCQLGLH